MPSLARGLEMYWDLDDLLETVTAAQGKYAELDLIIRDAFKVSKAKHLSPAILSHVYGRDSEQ
jgi:hypothetical protein